VAPSLTSEGHVQLEQLLKQAWSLRDLLIYEPVPTPSSSSRLAFTSVIGKIKARRPHEPHPNQRHHGNQHQHQQPQQQENTQPSNGKHGYYCGISGMNHLAVSRPIVSQLADIFLLSTCKRGDAARTNALNTDDLFYNEATWEILPRKQKEEINGG